MPKRKTGPKREERPAETAAKNVPKPFTKADVSLEPFLATLNPEHIYICSLDRKDGAFKRRLFCVPLLLNICLSLAVLYRIRVGLPTYLGIFLSTLGYDTPFTVDIRGNPAGALVGIGVERAFMFLGDFLLIRLIGQWPWEFFLGKGFGGSSAEAGPVAWRRVVSFQSCEIIVRRSRRWDLAVFQTPSAIENLVHSFEADVITPFTQMIQERILPAVAPHWIAEKSGYQMLDKSWDLYFSGMIRAHQLVEAQTCTMAQFGTQVFVATQTWGWLSWEVKRDHGGKSDGTAESWHLDTIRQAFKNMDKEDVFYRSVDIIQNETSHPGRDQEERKARAVAAVQAEFVVRGIDYSAFWEPWGGIGIMPGLDSV